MQIFAESLPKHKGRKIFFDEIGNKNLKSHENRKNRRKSKQENVLHTYDDEDNSINENAASWEIAGAEITLCVSCSLIFQKETVFLGSCPVGAFWEAPKKNCVNPSIPKDQILLNISSFC